MSEATQAKNCITESESEDGAMKFVFVYENVHALIVAKEKYPGIVIELKCECKMPSIFG